MNIRWWQQNNLRGLIGALVAGPFLAGMWLAGCGGGGGGGNDNTPGFSVRGTVFAPGRTLSSVRKIVTRANPAYAPVPNVPVTVGQVNNNGTGFTTLAQTTTDSLGGYTLTLPIGVGPSPSLVVRAGGPTGVTLENIVTGPIVDISPETTAAVQVLFAAAQARGIVLSQLRLGNITEYINRAVQVASIGTPSATTARAVTDAKDVIQFSKTTNAVLNTVLTNINAASTPIPTNTPRRTPGGRGTPTPKGGVPTPPGGGSTPTPGGGGGNPTPIGGGGTPTPIGGGGNPTPRPTTGPTSSPFPTTTPGRTPGGTPFPTSQPTPSATFFPTPIRTPGGTPGGTPITNPTPLPTTSTTPGGFPTPAPTISVTPRPLSRRGRH